MATTRYQLSPVLSGKGPAMLMAILSIGPPTLHSCQGPELWFWRLRSPHSYLTSLLRPRTTANFFAAWLFRQSFWLPVFHRIAKQASLPALPSLCWNEWLSDLFWIFHVLTPIDVTARPLLIRGTSTKLNCSFNRSPCHRWSPPWTSSSLHLV
jgi:hypothetical protein